MSLSSDDDTEERISSTSRLGCKIGLACENDAKSLFDLNTCIHKSGGGRWGEMLILILSTAACFVFYPKCSKLA